MSRSMMHVGPEAALAASHQMRRPEAESAQHRALVMVAAGEGRRLGRRVPKAQVELDGRPILAHALDAVRPELAIELVVLVLPGDPTAYRELARLGADLAASQAVEVIIVGGGPTRTASVGEGVDAVAEYARTSGWDPAATTMLIHDAARPLTPPEVHARVAEAVEAGQAAVVPAVAVTDTVKRVSRGSGVQPPPSELTGHATEFQPHQTALHRAVELSQGYRTVKAQQHGEESPVGRAEQRTDRPAPGTSRPELVAETLPRDELRAVQTPQGFTLEFLQRAFVHVRALPEPQAELLTDEAMIAEDLGVDVVVVPGDPQALKITAETDIITAETMLDREAARHGSSQTGLRPQTAPASDAPDEGPPADQTGAPRIGIGQDFHAFAPDGASRELWLAGLHWPGEPGLTGHSDGDAVAHACCDALFSAAGIGDMGTHFGADTIGTGRPELRGASGATLLAEAARLVGAAGWRIGNVAVQFVARRPAFAPRRQEAQRVLSDAAGAPVSISATTSDGLGFPGRREGIVATATAVLVRS